MSYKTIAVFFNRKENAERTAEFACKVARKFDAHLVGICLSDPIELHTGISTFIAEGVISSYVASQKKVMEATKKIFEHHAANEGIISEWRSGQSHAKSIGTTLNDYTRCADLIIMPQYEADVDRTDYPATLDTVIRESGRPVLVIPFAGNFESIGDSPLIGWSATREATRAVHDGLPFVQKAGKASVMTVISAGAEKEQQEFSVKELATTLDRHGINATVLNRPKGTISIGDQLLNESFDTGSDLIITGAYGHSTIYDFVIGATTSHILEHMTAPVLFSH